MNAGLDTLGQVFDRFSKIAGLASLAYLLAMGLAYRKGVSLGWYIGCMDRVRREKPVFLELSPGDSPVVFWKDERLIEGGFKGGVYLAFWWLVLALIVLNGGVVTRFNGLPWSIATSLMFPNGLVALWVFARSFESGDIRRSLWKSAVASIAGAGVGWFLGLWIGNSDTNRRNDLLKEMFLAFQLGVALFQAFVVSRLSGVFAGISSTDYEARFPAVQVSTIDGSSRDDLRLTKANGSEYRFVGPDGLEFLIPREHVRLVRRRLPD